MVSPLHLLIIDPQNDFCDLPPDYCPPTAGHKRQPLKPQLPVPGAHADMQRLAGLIDAAAASIDQITLTFDSHHHVGIERPSFWFTAQGQAVAPFTSITAAQLQAGEFVPRERSLLPQVLAYLQALEAGGRYTHMVWPAHCEMGSWGHNLHADVLAACNRWEAQGQRQTGKVFKGQNPLTEHYSAIRAEVPDPNDPATQINTGLMAWMNAAATIWVAGEAGSHCVMSTCDHLLEYGAAGTAEKLVLLTDCISPVTGFEKNYQNWLQTMQSRGVRLAHSTEWAELL